MNEFDVFISYRREGGLFLALHIKTALEKRGYSVFMDIENMKSGPFNEILYDKIQETENFILVLSRDSLDRCADSDDWVRKEIAHAIKNSRNIVPVLEPGFKMPKASDLPSDIAKLVEYNGLTPSGDLFDASMDKLASFFVSNRRIEAPATAGEHHEYTELEQKWHTGLKESDANLVAFVQACASDDTSDQAIREMRDSLVQEISDVLDIYPHLRPLEKSTHLAENMDSNAYIFSILSRRHDIEELSYDNRYKNEPILNLNILLTVACAQAKQEKKQESVASFRRIIRAVDLQHNNLQKSAFKIAYNISRVLCSFTLPADLDPVFDAVAYYDRAFLKKNCAITLELFRNALELEFPLDLEGNKYDIASYGILMDEVGFWKEALSYLEKARLNFPEDKIFRERCEAIRPTVEGMDTSGSFNISMKAHQIAPLNCQYGGRQRLDEMIEKQVPKFWSDIVEGALEEMQTETVKDLF